MEENRFSGNVLSKIISKRGLADRIYDTIIQSSSQLLVKSDQEKDGAVGRARTWKVTYDGVEPLSGFASENCMAVGWNNGQLTSITFGNESCAVNPGSCFDGNLLNVWPCYAAHLESVNGMVEVDPAQELFLSCSLHDRWLNIWKAFGPTKLDSYYLGNAAPKRLAAPRVPGPKSCFAVACLDGSAHFFNTEVMESVSVLVHQQSVADVALDESGTLMATACYKERCVHVWDLRTNFPVRRLGTMESPGRFIEFADDRKLVSVSQRSTLFTWDLGYDDSLSYRNFATGGSLCTLLRAEGDVIVVGSQDGLVNFFEKESALEPIEGFIGLGGELIDACRVNGTKEWTILVAAALQQ